MAIASISRFETASRTSIPIEDPFTAPIVLGDAAFDFYTILKTLAEHRTESGRDHYHSFCKWADGHDVEAHESTTCLTLEYTEDTADEVRAGLIASRILHYEFPTKAGRKKAVMFAFPLEDHLGFSDTTRAASLLAEGIAVKGVVKNSYFYTYFFRFQKGAEVIQRGEDVLNRELIDNNSGMYVQMSKWLAA